MSTGSNNWKEYNLRDVLICLESGGRPKGGCSDSDEDVPSLGGEHVNRDGTIASTDLKFISNDFYANMSRGKVEKKDILLVKDGATTGKVGLVKLDYPFDKVAVNEHVFICRVKPDVIMPEYLFYHLFSSDGQRQIQKNFHGSAQGGINQDFADNYSILIPPLDTQRKIVAILDKAEEVRRLRARANELTQTLLQSVFLEMFGDPAKDSPVSLGEVCTTITDGEHQTPVRCEEGVCLLSARNIQNHSIDLTDVDYIGEDEYQRICRRVTPKQGDVLISCSGTIGRVARVKQDFKFQMVRSVALLRPDVARLNPAFLEYCLDTPYVQRQMLKSVNQSSQANLFQGKIRELKIPLPPLGEQVEFSIIVKKVEETVSTQTVSGTELNQLIMNLIDRAFTGGLVA